jgi:hypothetical protein
MLPLEYEAGVLTTRSQRSVTLHTAEGRSTTCLAFTTKQRQSECDEDVLCKQMSVRTDSTQDAENE